MIEIGRYHELTILRETDPGLYLGDDQEHEVLLPHKHKPAEYEIGDTVRVFVYLDNEERPIATSLESLITLNSFAYLHCNEVTTHGAFMDMGIEKDLFVPFKEQARPMKADSWYVVHMYLDELSHRLVGSSKTQRFLSNETLTVAKYDEVEVLITHITERGANAIINGVHKGLIYTEDIFEDLRTGDRLTAFVKKVRQDNKIDLVLHSPGFRSIEPNAKYVLEELQAAGGFIPLHDKSEPDAIKNELGLSKKSFKRAIGSLYKNKQIVITETGIQLVTEA